MKNIGRWLVNICLLMALYGCLNNSWIDGQIVDNIIQRTEYKEPTFQEIMTQIESSVKRRDRRGAIEKYEELHKYYYRYPEQDAALKKQIEAVSNFLSWSDTCERIEKTELDINCDECIKNVIHNYEVLINYSKNIPDKLYFSKEFVTELNENIKLAPNKINEIQEKRSKIDTEKIQVFLNNYVKCSEIETSSINSFQMILDCYKKAEGSLKDIPHKLWVSDNTFQDYKNKKEDTKIKISQYSKKIVDQRNKEIQEQHEKQIAEEKRRQDETKHIFDEWREKQKQKEARLREEEEQRRKLEEREEDLKRKKENLARKKQDENKTKIKKNETIKEAPSLSKKSFNYSEKVIEVSAPLKSRYLYREYESNEVSADQRYKGRVLEVSGRIVHIGKDLADNIYITLPGDGFIFAVQCYFSNEYANLIATLKQGQEVVIKGNCGGKFGNVLLSDCILTYY